MKTTTNTKATSIRLVLLFAVLLLSSFKMSAQDVSRVITSDTTTEVSASTVQNVSANSSMNFVSWFMGTKQTPNANGSIEASSKKQMITSGISPNRLLIKAFLKKATNYTSIVA